MPELSRHVDETLDSILTRPKMWGGPEAIELQVLLLLEIKALLHGRGGDPDDDPRDAVMSRYRAFLRLEAGVDTVHLLSGQTSDVDRIISQLTEFRRREASPQSPQIVELSAALELVTVATGRVHELRRAIIHADQPRRWSFSHGGVSCWEISYPAERNFAYCTRPRAEVEAELRDATRCIPFDRTKVRYEVQATAACALTNESVTIYVPIEQDEPECSELKGHDWVVMLDARDLEMEELPLGRRLTEGCVHCGCQKNTLWRDARVAETVEVTYEASHYPEGVVARRRRSEA